MEDRRLDSSEFQQLLCVLMPQVAKLVAAAESQGYMLPFELLATDADDQVVWQLELNARGAVRNLAPDLDVPLKGRAPLTISLCDQAGHVWNWNFGKPASSYIQ
jgi:hypothetical protein